MQKPKEFRRIYFEKQDLAEALLGAAGAQYEASISRHPKIYVTLTAKGQKTQQFDEAQIIEALCKILPQFKIPIPRGYNKRIIVDRDRNEAIVLQMGNGLLF